MSDETMTMPGITGIAEPPAIVEIAAPDEPATMVELAAEPATPDEPAAPDPWPAWVVDDVEGRLLRLRSRLESHAAGTHATRAEAGASMIPADRGTPSLAGAGAPRPSGFDVLARLFGLSPFEEDVLALALAPEVDAAFRGLLAEAQADPRRTHPTPHLAVDLFAGSFAERLVGRRSFLPGSPLVRFRLIRLDDPGDPGATPADAVLRLEPRVADFLLGLNRPDDEVRRAIERVQPGPLLSAHRELIDALVETLRPLLSHHPRPVLHLVGPAGSGRHVLAEALCARLGLDLYRLDLSVLPSEPAQRDAVLRAIDRDAVLSAVALYVDATGPHEHQNVLADVLRDRESFVITGSTHPLAVGTGDLTVDVPGPDPSASLERWQAALGARLPDGEDALDVAEQFAFGPRSIQRAAAGALGRAAADGRSLTAGDLVRACRRQAGSGLDDLAQRLEPRYDWGGIVLPADLAGHLREIAGQVGHRFQVYERWGFGTKHARGRGITVLFAGPSGTGKTMAAEVLANDLGLDLYRIDLAGVVSKYIGETEKNLRRLFDAAERTGSVLLFDEADALFGKRTEVRDSHDRYANIEINYLLQRMEDYRGLAILATNMRSLLDHAFLRRLRFILDFPFPDRASRREIWARIFPPEAGARIDPDALSRLEIAGGSIRSIAVNAAFAAAEEGVAIGMDHVLRAARREYTKIDKLVLESDFDPRPGAAA